MGVTGTARWMSTVDRARQIVDLAMNDKHLLLNIVEAMEASERGEGTPYQLEMLCAHISNVRVRVDGVQWIVCLDCNARRKWPDE